MSRPYVGGRLSAPVPPGELTTLRLGQIAQVYHTFERSWGRVGEVVYLIEPNTVPDPAAMELLFRNNRAANGLKRYPIPTRASKDQRVILRNRSGNCYAFVVNPNQHQFYPGSTKEER